MSAVDRILEDYAAQAASAARAEPGPRAAARLAAAQALRLHALPTRRDENWRYTNLTALESIPSFQPSAAGAARVADAAAARPSAALPSGLLPAPLPGYTRLVWVDGRLRLDLSLPDTALLDRLRSGAAPTQHAEATPFEVSGDGRFGLIASMFAPDPLTLRISGTMALELISIATATTNAVYTEIDLQLAPHTKLDLVERHFGSAGPAKGPSGLTCAKLRLTLDADAQLTHTRLQQTGPGALYYDTLSVRLGQRAGYRLAHVAAGGGNARSSTEIRLQGREAQLQIRALATAHADQVCDAFFTVHHEAPGTRSDQLFRGVAGDRARVACSGNVEVAAQAPGSRVQQSLRGLIDGSGAEVDLRPRLTINTDDIQAAHGATTGQLDDNLMFYLLSRGLDPAEARSLLKWAFLGEALSAVDPPVLRKAAEQATAGRLTDAPAAELLQ